MQVEEVVGVVNAIVDVMLVTYNVFHVYNGVAN